MSGNKKNTIERVHTLTWEDPKISARDAGSISGIDYLCAIKNGQIESPPVAKLVGYRIAEVESGRAESIITILLPPSTVVSPALYSIPR
jgi:hypothetical protein